jgi:hypothetical protein
VAEAGPAESRSKHEPTDSGAREFGGSATRRRTTTTSPSAVMVFHARLNSNPSSSFFT